MMNVLKNINVLYVDDDRVACKSMKKTLNYYFKEVFIAYNGVEALEVYEKNDINLLLVDYDMPIMNGHTFLTHVREKDYFIPAVIVSSYSDKEKLQSAIKLHLVDYLIRPFNFEELQSVLKLCQEWIEKNNILKMPIIDNVFYDKTTSNLIDNKKKVHLTKYESLLLASLLKNRDQIVIFESIAYTLNNKDISRKSLTSIVYKINKKIGTSVIKNVKEIGYMIKADSK